MRQIYPICQETCKPLVGQRFCAVMHDGRHVYGTLSYVHEHGLEFDGACKGANVLSTKAYKAKKQLQDMHKAKAKIKNYGYGYGNGYGNGYGYGGGYGYGYGNGAGLAWASIALLFLLPFFFI
ncbi:hypothetical protein [Paenibacillus pini]|uniref:Uncharacterized protein n=1 Tax=Paenibacillus pini JCM 16418 TaxID=1236976 RepID=W7YGL5_9BACL|nr:hypothetical protein [Paenibacillus pini]GAF07597.1 hypothetical protein JCM16418_1624 [Paenibacillus pini JCM 16418]